MREGEKQIRVHLWVYENDYEWLKMLYGNTVGVSKTVRTILRKYRNGLEAKAQSKLDERQQKHEENEI